MARSNRSLRNNLACLGPEVAEGLAEGHVNCTDPLNQTGPAPQPEGNPPRMSQHDTFVHTPLRSRWRRLGLWA